MATCSYSPFFDPGLNTSSGRLALLALSRHNAIPALLRKPDLSDPTDEITNTRFGSFPHGTLVNRQWGDQVVASKVEAREKRRGKKRKRPDSETESPTTAGIDEDDIGEDSLAFEAASSGFVHLLPPTPELWTASLPHRTQVVYPRDYSYILQRLHARPGRTIIEAGAGSGSFTHAAARAVFSGSTTQCSNGKVYSFEYHEPRFERLKQEIHDHQLGDVVHITHRDVYEKGFILDDGRSPQADAVFFDLPAPWRALDHLSRQTSSPLNPSAPIRLCTFSPCIEQVEQTVAALRRLGWTEIDMVEVQHKRIDVRRERIGLQEEGLRGVNAVPASVEEAVGRLRQLEDSQAEFHKKQSAAHDTPDNKHKKKGNADGTLSLKQARAETNKRELGQRKIWKEVLPQVWTEEDEKMNT